MFSKNKKACNFKIAGFISFKCAYKISSFTLSRRVRDSNPRTCYSQQFSRLPQSTTLPTLLNIDATVVFSGANIGRFSLLPKYF